MEEKFADIILRDDVIRRGDRAHAIRDVRSTVLADTGPERYGSRQWVHAWRRLRSGGCEGRVGLVLSVEGPGFVWNVRIDSRRRDAAVRFADIVNAAARRTAA
jgi:hypothetical protein